MSYLFVTADEIGTPTGGGLVTAHEGLALQSIAPSTNYWGHAYREISRPQLAAMNQGRFAEPWCWDNLAYSLIEPPVELAHFYSGSFTSCVAKLKQMGAKVSYTCAAHDKDISREEHLKLGMDFPFAHLTDPVLWDRYSLCYRQADVLICPGKRPAEICKRYGCKGRIEIIPHGCTLPKANKPIRTDKFVLGYMGAVGPDKGLMYLLQAWKQLGYKDATFLLAARQAPGGTMAQHLISMCGCEDLVRSGSICSFGWADNISDFYEQISCYCQPSATEGFGLEVLEAMAHGRPALCSDGAGAADLVPERWVFPARNADALTTLIDQMKSAMTKHSDLLPKVSQDVRTIAGNYTWDRIRARYVEVWRSLL